MSVLRVLTYVPRTATTTSAPTPAAVTLDTDSMLMDLLVMVILTAYNNVSAVLLFFY